MLHNSRALQALNKALIDSCACVCVMQVSLLLRALPRLLRCNKQFGNGLQCIVLSLDLEQCFF